MNRPGVSRDQWRRNQPLTAHPTHQPQPHHPSPTVAYPLHARSHVVRNRVNRSDASGTSDRLCTPRAPLTSAFALVRGWSRLSESNRRPAHYEEAIPRPLRLLPATTVADLTPSGDVNGTTGPEFAPRLTPRAGAPGLHTRSGSGSHGSGPHSETGHTPGAAPSGRRSGLVVEDDDRGHVGGSRSTLPGAGRAVR